MYYPGRRGKSERLSNGYDRKMACGRGRPVSGWVSIVTKYEVQAYEEIMNGVKEPEQALKDAAEAARAELDAQN